jgi:hypothetical protein
VTEQRQIGRRNPTMLHVPVLYGGGRPQGQSLPLPIELTSLDLVLGRRIDLRPQKATGSRCEKLLDRIGHSLADILGDTTIFRFRTDCYPVTTFSAQETSSTIVFRVERFWGAFCRPLQSPGHGQWG